MKNAIKITSTLLILLISMGLFAQDKNHDNKLMGVRAGWQYSGIYNDGALPEGSDPLSSFYAGFFKEIKLIPLLRFDAGIEYAPVGISDSDSDSKIVLHYLSVPLNLRVKLGPVYALGGAAANFRLAEKWTIAGESYTPEDDMKSNVFDVPLYLGLGVKILFLSIDARYYWGMIDIYDNSDGSSKSQYLQIGASVYF
jgi:hypothetical protein